MAKFTLDPKNPPALGERERAAMEAMTPETIEANAASDPDNPPLTREELALVQGAQAVRETRRIVGLSQELFAAQYHVSLGRLRDLEQGRTAVDSAMAAYLAVIRAMPQQVVGVLSGLPPADETASRSRRRRDLQPG